MSKRLQRLLTKSGTTIVAYENQTVNVIWTFAKNGKKTKTIEKYEKAIRKLKKKNFEKTTEKKQEKERLRLFKIVEDLVQWENTTNEEVLQKARDAIWESWRRTCAENADHPRAKELFDRHVLPAFHDPFAGGGALPLEAQRLGLESYASDLNPVAVLINKAMIEIPPKFANRPPVNPDWQRTPPEEKILRQWHGAQGLKLKT
jgi:adenine-specific DNA methylase